MNTTINRIAVKNMESPKSNHPVANQYLIYTNDGLYFQSYRSIIAFMPNNPNAKTVLDSNYWNYSRTTGKYRNIFLRENTAETRKKIKSGEYILADLN